jgi:putative endonuclease
VAIAGRRDPKTGARPEYSAPMPLFPAIGDSWLTAQRWGLLHLQALGQRLHPRYANAPHLLTGERGELEALFFLRRQGYIVIERRWTAPDLRGDLDLIAWDGDFLCCIEVKTRTARDLTPAQAAVDDTKRRMLRALARAFRRTLPRQRDTPIPLRFDVVSVYLLPGEAQCELFRGVFSLIPNEQGDDRRRYGV